MACFWLQSLGAGAAVEESWALWWCRTETADYVQGVLLINSAKQAVFLLQLIDLSISKLTQKLVDELSQIYAKGRPAGIQSRAKRLHLAQWCTNFFSWGPLNMVLKPPQTGHSWAKFASADTVFINNKMQRTDRYKIICCSHIETYTVRHIFFACIYFLRISRVG